MTRAEQVVDEDTWAIVVSVDPHRTGLTLTAGEATFTLSPEQARELAEQLDAALIEPTLCRGKGCYDAGVYATQGSEFCAPHQGMHP